MAITNGYCTLLDVLERMEIEDSQDNDKLESVIEACSRWIDGHTGRVFYTTTEARYYTARYTNVLYIDDATSITQVDVDSANDRTYATTWASTDWEADTRPGWPITEIYTTPNGNYGFPSGRRGVKVTGTWGFATSVPKPVKEACVLLSMRLFLRKDAVFGVVEGGNVANAVTVSATIRADADVVQILQPYRRMELV